MSIESTENLPYGDILLVDDNPSNLQSLSDILTVTGYQVQTAIDGESALRIVQVKQPELILLDYKMAGMDGIEVCRRLKERPETKDIPVIFLSAHGDTDLKVKALEAGGIDYVLKPAQPSEVLAKIDNHLKLYRLQRRLAEQSEELQEREEKFRSIFNTSVDSIFVVSQAGIIVGANSTASTMYGYTANEMTGIPIENMFHPDHAFLAEEFKKQMQNTGIFQVESVAVRKDGTPFNVEIRGSSFQYMNGPHFLIIVRDITEKKKMEEQLFQNEKMATIAGLAAGIAHEINTPLSAILQSHQLIEMALSPEEPNSTAKAAECHVDLAGVQEYFKKNDLDYFMGGIRESALKASHIINNLLEFSRPHEGSFSTISLEELMENSLLLAQADYDMKKKYGISTIQFVKEYGPNLTSVICVATEIEQVILSLVKNSVQAMAEADLQEKPRITLRLTTGEKSAVIEVEDNGPGITEDVKSHIFDPFFTTREVGCGTGLGLSVSHTIVVDKHKGKIRVESEPGQGAKFIVELPLQQDD